MNGMNISETRHDITLYYDDAASNKDRFYHMELSVGLWGNLIVERQWGRRGTWGQFRLDCFENHEAAIGAMQKIIRSKLARGYSLERDIALPKLNFVECTVS
jgi:predicted DNA-binding WGR domain protein